MSIEMRVTKDPPKVPQQSRERFQLTAHRQPDFSQSIATMRNYR